MKFASLCSGSKGNCSIIQTEECTIMIDCGASQKYIKERCNEINCRLDQIDAVFITHTHYDHIRSINLMKNKPLFGCADYDGVKKIEPLKEYRFKDLRIIAIPVSHDSPNTVGYVIYQQDEKLVYITDTGYIPKRYTELLQNAEYYFIESNHDVPMLMKTNRPHSLKSRIYSDKGHMCNEDCATALCGLIGPSTKQITLAHLSEEANDPKLAFETIYDKIKNHPLNEKVELQVAKQFEICRGGNQNEKDFSRSDSVTDMLERLFDISTQ